MVKDCMNNNLELDKKDCFLLGIMIWFNVYSLFIIRYLHKVERILIMLHKRTQIKY